MTRKSLPVDRFICFYFKLVYVNCTCITCIENYKNYKNYKKNILEFIFILIMSNIKNLSGTCFFVVYKFYICLNNIIFISLKIHKKTYKSTVKRHHYQYSFDSSFYSYLEFKTIISHGKFWTSSTYDST